MTQVPDGRGGTDATPFHAVLFLKTDRNEVRERIARAVEADPKPFFTRYFPDAVWRIGW